MKHEGSSRSPMDSISNNRISHNHHGDETMKPDDDIPTTSVVLVGVGGQGILLASEIIAKTAMIAGYDVKTNEVHGMAQRGGSVVAQVRFGKRVHSPLVAKKTAAVLGALEHVEALRYSDYLRDGGLCVVNKESIPPVTMSESDVSYPKDVEEMLKIAFPRLIYMDASKIALMQGSIKAANVVLLGAISRGLNLPLEAWKEAITTSVKEKHRELNLKAFEAGRNVGSDA